MGPPLPRTTLGASYVQYIKRAVISPVTLTPHTAIQSAPPSLQFLKRKSILTKHVLNVVVDFHVFLILWTEVFVYNSFGSNKKKQPVTTFPKKFILTATHHSREKLSPLNV
jgi:hypothetical protein